MTDETMPSVNDENEAKGIDRGLNFAQDSIDAFLDTIGVDEAFGPPIKDGKTLIIPAAEVFSTLGFGGGFGTTGMDQPGQEGGPQSGMGGGGGGHGFSRPVAVIISTPEGVRVEPVLDVTKIGLAALSVFGFMFGMVARIRRGR